MALLTEILRPALRIAGITKLPGIIPSTDQFSELIPRFCAMIGSWNVQPSCIAGTTIEQFNLVTGQLSYTIGPGGQLNTAKPIKIKEAVIILNPTASAPVRMPPMQALTDEDWANVALQNVPNTIPLAFYYDYKFDTASALGKIYLWGQSQAGLAMELYTWTTLKSTFTAVTDDFVAPEGYVNAAVLNFAMEVKSLYPNYANMDPDVPRRAAKALHAVQAHNLPVPSRMVSDAASIQRSAGGHFDWRIGLNR